MSTGVIAKRDQRQLPLVEEEHGGDAHDRDHVLGEENEAVAAEEANRLQVNRRARHQLTRLMAVVIPERETEETSVECVPHVPLDGERLLPGDEPATEHEQCPEETDAEDDEDQERQIVAVLAAAELVDHEACEHDHRDRRRLREDREDRRDDQRGAVRPQKLKKPNEGAGVRGGDQVIVGAASIRLRATNALAAYRASWIAATAAHVSSSFATAAHPLATVAVARG